MLKVRWVLLFGFWSKFRTLSSAAKFFENQLRFDKDTEFKGGNFFETQCSSSLVVFLFFSID